MYPRPLAVCFGENRVRPYLGSYGLDTTNNIYALFLHRDVTLPISISVTRSRATSIDVTGASHDAMTPSVYVCLFVSWGDSARGEIPLVSITNVRSGVCLSVIPVWGDRTTFIRMEKILRMHHFVANCDRFCRCRCCRGNNKSGRPHWKGYSKH